MKRKIQSDKDASTVNEIVIRGNKDIANKIKMNFKNLKVKMNQKFSDLKKYTKYHEYFQTKTLNTMPKITRKYKFN